LRRKRLVKLGVAVQFPRVDGSGTYWEHGASVNECRREREYKQVIHEGRADGRELSARINRMARLIARLCGKLQLSYEDARAVGYCEAGNRGWCKQHGINPVKGTTLAQVRGLNGPLGQVIMYKAVEVAKRKLIKV
jgi:hypothetical protein